MTIWDVIKEGNGRKNKTKLKRLMEVKRYFISMYRCYAVKLYDMNYISDPTKLDRKQIIGNIIDMGINDLFNYTGKLELTSDHALFAYYRNKGDAEKSVFLKTLYNMLKYKEFASKVDSLYEEYGFRNSDSSVIKINMLAKGAMIVQKSGIAFTEATARCISTFETDTKYLSINNELWVMAMNELNIPKNDWYLDGLFDSRLSHDEEVECMEGILNGYFKVYNGKYSNELQKWLFNHRWSSDVMHKADLQGLYDYLFSARVSEVESVLNSKLKELCEGTEKVSILAVDKDKIYYNVNRTELLMPFGVFSIVCDKDDEEYLLPDLNIVNGYTGELYTEDRLIDNGIQYVGCPICMNKTRNSLIMLYDLEQTDIRSDSWFFCNADADIVFDDELTGIPVNDFKAGTLSYEMYEGYLNSLKSSDGLISKIHVSNFEDFEFAKKELFKKLGE